MLLDGRGIGGLPGHAVARLGVVRTFQNIRLFGRLTSLQNVEVSALAAGEVKRATLASAPASCSTSSASASWPSVTRARSVRRPAARLEVARALAARPRFLLLDEPAAGMNEVESDELGASIERIRRQRGCGVLVVEHDLRLIMRLCDTIYVLNEGEVISQGTAEHVRADPAVIAAYIGEEERKGGAG